MKNVNPLLIALVVIVVLAGGAWLLLGSNHETTAAASPSGSSFGDAGFAGSAVSLAAPGANGTSTSILNNSGQDRIITAEKVGCENVGTSKTAYTGTGLASLTVTIATTSTATPSALGNTNTLPVITIGTSTANFATASSTAGTPGSNLVTNIWAAGTYLTFATNATNTAACTYGVDYLST